MAKTIAIANQKGGVGKTTTAINLCAALGETHTRSAIISSDQVKFDVLPSNADLTAAEVQLMSTEGREQRLAQALHSVAADYDYIYIDCPPALNVLTLNAFVAANGVLIPMQCEYYALEGLSSLLQTIGQVQASVNPGLVIEGILRTMFDGRNKLGHEVSAQLIEHFESRVYRTIIPRNIRLAEAPSFGQPIVYYDKSSRGSIAYLALAGEIIRREMSSELPAAKPDGQMQAGLADATEGGGLGDKPLDVAEVSALANDR